VKITKGKLRQLIREEIELLNEAKVKPEAKPAFSGILKNIGYEKDMIAKPFDWKGASYQFNRDNTVTFNNQKYKLLSPEEKTIKVSQLYLTSFWKGHPADKLQIVSLPKIPIGKPPGKPDESALDQFTEFMQQAAKSSSKTKIGWGTYWGKKVVGLRKV